MSNASSVDEYLEAPWLAKLANGVLEIPESENRFFMLAKPEDDTILLPPHLSDIYILKWANPTRIGAGAGVAYSLDVKVSGEPTRARTRHLYITYMDEAGPSRCRVALASAIKQLGPILYTAEADARDVSGVLVAHQLVLF
ncbi:hypothetical protein PHLCEN_2v11351 [Hermanssonia centrifuga]|uniref:Uncharacterized protein n=1 Tax=Hermanssonia centrifuga TaxID=98765 RepID=A0A2R6NKM4_9APHY|nr:hypothetical protein PHLCEN_2v11351 [Hermanssonia centrifuga]